MKGLVCALYARGCWCWTEQIFWECINFQVSPVVFWVPKLLSFSCSFYQVDKFLMALSSLKWWSKGKYAGEYAELEKSGNSNPYRDSSVSLSLFLFFSSLLSDCRTWHDCKLRIKGQVCKRVCNWKSVGTSIHTGIFQYLWACLCFFLFFNRVTEHGTIVN